MSKDHKRAKEFDLYTSKLGFQDSISEIKRGETPDEHSDFHAIEKKAYDIAITAIKLMRATARMSELNPACKVIMATADDILDHLGVGK